MGELPGQPQERRDDLPDSGVPAPDGTSAAAPGQPEEGRTAGAAERPAPSADLEATLGALTVLAEGGLSKLLLQARQTSNLPAIRQLLYLAARAAEAGHAGATREQVYDALLNGIDPRVYGRAPVSQERVGYSQARIFAELDPGSRYGEVKE